MKIERTIERRPANGCARCIWWTQNDRNNNGLCHLLGTSTWWQHAPCDEYELDPDTLETISLLALVK